VRVQQHLTAAVRVRSGMLRGCLLLMALLLGSSCAVDRECEPFGIQFDLSHSAMLVAGETTLDEAVALLGAPPFLREDVSPGLIRATWFYSDRELQINAQRIPTAVLSAEFSSEGILQEVVYQYP
jgi:hypothetical protein